MAISGALDALILEQRHLSEAESEQAIESILAGQATDTEIENFLVALHNKGETAAELTGAARAMRKAAGTPPYSPPNTTLLDTCGTGGDRSGTFNISTIAALVVAGAGVPVAKHGNRSLSSACGSADLLEALGVDLRFASTTLAAHGIAFYFAPLFHGATRFVQPVRARLKTRTIFNYLGPLTNPAGANVQVAGAFSAHAAALMAAAFAHLGLPRGFVVHGSDGLDEVTTTGETQAFAIEHGVVTPRVLTPEDFGLDRSTPRALLGGDILQNRSIALAILSGDSGARTDVVLANAALALHAASVRLTLIDAMEQARESLTSGNAMAKLEALKLQKSAPV